MNPVSLFDLEFRLRELDQCGDPLVQLNEIVDWEGFRDTLTTIRDKHRKSNAGRRPFDVVLMFKILILQSLYNLADEAVEYQIRDRLSFMRFLGLGLGDTVPDQKTIWLFRDQLRQAGLVEKLFAQFDAFLRENGFAACKGQIIDASIIAVPRQRNSREENARIKNGAVPADWSEAKRRQKDVDARWVKKNNKNHYGYKNHIAVDVKHKLIRDWDVTSAKVHDTHVFESLLDEDNSSRDVYADSAYRNRERVEQLKQDGYRPRLQRKGGRGGPLSARERQGNRTRAKTRCRVEHVFGIQTMRAGNLLLRTIGIARGRAKIGLRNLAYNLTRYAQLTAATR